MISFPRLTFTKAASVIMDHPWWMFSLSSPLDSRPATSESLHVEPGNYLESFQVNLMWSWQWGPAPHPHSPTPLPTPHLPAPFAVGRRGCTGAKPSGQPTSGLRIRAGAFASLSSTLFLQTPHGIPASTRSEKLNSYMRLSLNRLLLLPFVTFACISVIWASYPCLVRLQVLHPSIHLPSLPRPLWLFWPVGQQAVCSQLLSQCLFFTAHSIGRILCLQRSTIIHSICSLEPSKLCPVLSTLNIRDKVPQVPGYTYQSRSVHAHAQKKHFPAKSNIHLCVPKGEFKFWEFEAVFVYPICSVGRTSEPGTWGP